MSLRFADVRPVSAGVFIFGTLVAIAVWITAAAAPFCTSG